MAVLQRQEAGDLWEADGVVVVLQSCKEAKFAKILCDSACKIKIKK
jgi:hypothetical protein